MTPIEGNLRFARILHLILVIVPFLYILVLLELRPLERPVTPILIYAVAFECFAVIGVGFFLRARKVTVPAERLRTSPEDTAALSAWRSGQIISFTLAESVTLFGFVLKLLGSTWSVAGIFFAVGIFLLLLWTPKLDVTGSVS